MTRDEASAADRTRPILLVGATGMLGRPVAERLRASGWQVRVLSRDPAHAGQLLGPGFEIVHGDVRRPETLAAALAGCGSVHVNLRATDTDGLEIVEVAGTGSLAAAARAAGVARLTYLSAAGIESGDPALLPVRTKQRAEAAIRASGVSFTFLRATHFMESLDLFVRGNKAVLMGPQPQRFHYLAAADYAVQVERALTSPAAAGTALTLLGPEAFTMREALAVFIRLARPDLVLSEPPLWLLKTVAAVTGNASLRFATRLFDAFRRIPETGDGALADRLVGKAETSLEQWCQQRRATGPLPAR